MVGSGCATRKDSLPLAQVIWPGGGSGGGRRADVLEVLLSLRKSSHREEQPSGRKIPADLEVFGEKDYFYKKKDAQ